MKLSTLKIWKSLTATSISAITMMGMPSEYYTFGSTVAWGLIAEFIGNFHIFLEIGFFPSTDPDMPVSMELKFSIL